MENLTEEESIKKYRKAVDNILDDRENLKVKRFKSKHTMRKLGILNTCFGLLGIVYRYFYPINQVEQLIIFMLIIIGLNMQFYDRWR